MKTVSCLCIALITILSIAKSSEAQLYGRIDYLTPGSLNDGLNKSIDETLVALKTLGVVATKDVDAAPLMQGIGLEGGLRVPLNTAELKLGVGFILAMPTNYVVESQGLPYGALVGSRDVNFVRTMAHLSQTLTEKDGKSLYMTAGAGLGFGSMTAEESMYGLAKTLYGVSERTTKVSWSGLSYEFGLGAKINSVFFEAKFLQLPTFAGNDEFSKVDWHTLTLSMGLTF